jgi:hypothetical protein
MTHYTITLIFQSQRIVRNIWAANGIEAASAVLDDIELPPCPFAITCKVAA